MQCKTRTHSISYQHLGSINISCLRRINVYMYAVVLFIHIGWFRNEKNMAKYGWTAR